MRVSLLSLTLLFVNNLVSVSISVLVVNAYSDLQYRVNCPLVYLRDIEIYNNLKVSRLRIEFQLLVHGTLD